MAKPEIARRCPVCGASIREAALFCPQCGEEMAQQKLEEQPTTSVITTPLVDSLTAHDEADPEGHRADHDQDKLEPIDEEKLEPIEDAAIPTKKTPTAKAPAGKVRNKIQRATTLARDGGGDMIHRVQKVRQISSVVLDEAGYDPSLRFVLVAAALFLLFLLVLVLNKLIG